MNRSPGRHRRALPVVVRGAGALSALVVLVAGVPVALWAIDGSPVPGALPGARDVWEMLSRPDDGTFFLDVLILAGWLGWATFAVSVLLELPATVRGVSAPTIPGLGAQQRLVAALLATVATMVPTAQIAAADGPAAPAPPVTNELLDGRGDPPAEDGRAPSRVPSRALTHEVVAGDTLWDIAGTRLGDPTRYDEIARASAATVQPDGRRLTDPDLIVPGWTLTLPGTAGSPGEAGASPRHEIPRADRTEPTPEPPAAPPPDDTAPDDTATGAIGGTTDDAVDELADCLTADHTGVSERGDAELSASARTAGGVGVVLAAGLIGVLALRRARRQRRRRAGQRLVPDAAAERSTEVELRHVADPPGIEFVDGALRALAAQLHELGRPLPRLRAGRLTDSALELYLEVAAELPAPFVDLADGRAWRLPLHAEGWAGRAADQPAPYPSLVTIGHDSENALLLVDLEGVGSLAVDGPAEVTQAVLTAVAAEFATSPWADDIRVTVVGADPWADFETLETGRFRRVSDVERLLDELAVRARDDRRLLSEAGAGSLAAARLAQVAEATWTPEIILVADPLSPPQLRRLEALIDEAPRVAVAAMIRGQQHGRAWALRVSGTVGDPSGVLEPLGMTIRPQLFDHATHAHVTSLLRTSDHGTVGTPLPEPAVAHLPVLPTTGHRGFEPLLGDVPESAAEPRPADTAPRLIMMGPVEVIHTAELGERNKLGQLTELAMFVALNPGCDAAAIDEAIWPGSSVTRTTRNTAVSKLRRWLGTDTDGAPLLPRTEDRYSFRPDVRSDWDDWLDLLPDGPAQTSTDDLRAALALVKGRPFSGRGRRKYAWADHHAQEMIAAIVDAAHELAVRALASGDPREALRVVLLGLAVEPGVELLWRDRLKAEVLLGDRDTVLTSIDKLRDTADDLGGDLEDDTEDLIEQILHRSYAVAHDRRAGTVSVARFRPGA